jgi:hypothetical protein
MWQGDASLMLRNSTHLSASAGIIQLSAGLVVVLAALVNLEARHVYGSLWL